MERVRNLAVIPARSGSRGLKDKNIKKLKGKPLMAYSIEAALDAGIFDCVHVSTDSIIYQEVAEKYGADVSFLRPEGLCADTTDTWDALRYIVEVFEKWGRTFDRVTLLQPTSPLRTAKDIRESNRIFEEKDARSVISVCEVEYSPLFTKHLNRDMSMNGFVDLSKSVRRQEQETFYRLNGAIYMLERTVLDDIQELYGERSYAYLMPRERSVDIDMAEDFRYAEFLLS